MDHPVPGGWLPASSCTPTCLAAPAATRSRLHAALRLAAMVSVLALTAATTPLLPESGRRWWLRAGSQVMLRAAGVRLRLVGAWPAEDGALVVANHLSWIDVLALGGVAPVRSVAKREVGEWPIVGGLARCAGALFVDRAGLRALPAMVTAVADALRSGDCVAVFPEGTTWCGAAAGPFRRAAFQAALDVGAPVRPVAITLRHADGSRARAAAFVGEQSLLDSMLRVVRTPGLTCKLTPLPGLRPTGDRRDLARRAEEAIAHATGVQHHALSRVPQGAVRSWPELMMNQQGSVDRGRRAIR
jgi:1-acyl-sn-glycerol-3-phosphate acyltransferase